MGSAMSGKAFLVGSGPGDPGLLTLRGAECVRSADVIVYDYLACPEVLDWAPPGCEKIYVGKKAGCHSAPQEEINGLLLAKTAAGKQVVRLKGGDPFVFGRGGEEAEALAAHGVPFEIVPGVTSAVAAPAFAGIPVTHRSCSSSFYVVTGHEEPGKKESAIPWEALARSASTLIFLMGVKRLPVISARLIEAGLSPATPAAVVRWGGTQRQKTFTAPLGEIAELAARHAVRPPAVIVVGSVVGLRDRISWFERRPLFGKILLVTRAAGQASQLSAGLRALGAYVVELPAIAFCAPVDTAALDSAIRRVGEFRWLIFTSVNGVKWFLKRVWETGGDARSLAGPEVMTIGPATGQALEERGIRMRFPSTYIAEDLVNYLSKKEISGAKVLLAGAEEVRPALVEGLKRLGASVEKVACYRTVAAKADPSQAAELLKSGELDMFTFTSSSTVTHTMSLLEGVLPREELERVPAACLGPITAETARRAGLKVKVVAEEQTIDGLIRALLSFYSVD
jgi:uroporphyrinogen III methyltransferase/synthase